MNIKSKLSFIVATLVILNLTACENKPAEESAKTGVEAAATSVGVVVEVQNGYKATLAEGIQFADKQNYPLFVKSVTDMSNYETLGRWTDGEKVVFTFTQNLPNNFTLELDLADTFSTNIGKEIQVQVGDWSGQFVGVQNASNNKLTVKTTMPADSIVFTIPKPESPVNLGTGQDLRLLGIKFKKLSVIAE